MRSATLTGNIDALLQGYTATFTAPDNSVTESTSFIPASFSSSSGNGTVALLG